jgi:endonuclease YncB( thermonuclease family)
MAMAIDQTRNGLTFGRFGLGLHGIEPGSVLQQVHDGDTVNVRAIGNLSVRFLGIDTPEVSFTLPGRTNFVSIANPAWEAFLQDPFAPTLPPLALDPGLRANLQQRLGAGVAANHAAHSQTAHRELETLIQGDMNVRGLTKDTMLFFAAFAREIVDRYGRLLAFLNVDDPSAQRPRDYNTRMLEKGLATPYFIWPNVDPWQSAGSLSSAAQAPAQFRQVVNAPGKLLDARRAVAAARAQQIGIFAQGNPLRLHAFELRYLAGRRPPDRWVIDLGANDDMILKPQNYHTIDNVEDRLFIPADFLCLFQHSGWQLQA